MQHQPVVIGSTQSNPHAGAPAHSGGKNKHSTTNPRYPTSSDWTSHQASKVERYVAAAALALAARRKDPSDLVPAMAVPSSVPRRVICTADVQSPRLGVPADDDDDGNRPAFLDGSDDVPIPHLLLQKAR
ncbi:hypothetical protein BHM03_00038003 [Ensete ventricosum]|nr:hypothetical protein BHM03_00038003 [Ensete ventricosum]